MDGARREKGRGGVHVPLVNWDGAVKALRGRAWPRHHPIRESDSISAQRPFQVDDDVCR